MLSVDEMPTALARFREDPPLLRQRIEAALNALCEEADIGPNKVVAIGYCFGGMAVLELARAGTPVAGVVSFHGLLTTKQPAKRVDISARILACTGALDPLVPPEDLATFQSEMTEAALTGTCSFMAAPCTAILTRMSIRWMMIACGMTKQPIGNPGPRS